MDLVNRKRYKIFIPLLFIVVILGTYILFINADGLDTRFVRFESWMRLHGYSSDIIDIYRCNYAHPGLRNIMRDYFLIREGNLRHPKESYIGNRKFRKDCPVDISFIEVIPTDKEADYALVDEDMLKSLEKYLNDTFGRQIRLVYLRRNVDYQRQFGSAIFDFKAMFPYGMGASLELKTFEGQFEPPCIIHFDAEYLQGMQVADIWNVSHCAIFMGERYRVIDDIQTFDAYAHEVGHMFGLDHQFVDFENPPRNTHDKRLIKNFLGEYLGIDDVMIKSAAPKNPLRGRMLSPLSLYVIEPKSGYNDTDSMAARYQEAFSRDVIEAVKAHACASLGIRSRVKSQPCDKCVN